MELFTGISTRFPRLSAFLMKLRRKRVLYNTKTNVSDRALVVIKGVAVMLTARIAVPWIYLLRKWQEATGAVGQSSGVECEVRGDRIKPRGASYRFPMSEKQKTSLWEVFCSPCARSTHSTRHFPHNSPYPHGSLFRSLPVWPFSK